jgi:uncharacterized membrane protein YesL
MSKMKVDGYKMLCFYVVFKYYVDFTLNYCLLFNLGILFGVSVPATMLLALNAIAFIVAQILDTASVSNSSFTV